MHLLARLDQGHFPIEQLLQLAITRTDLIVHQGSLLTQHRLHHPLTVLAHDIETAIGNGLHSVHIHFLLSRDIVSNRSVALWLGHTEQLEQANVTPANVHFIPAAGQFRRVRISMVIVVQLFTTDQDAQRRYISSVISTFIVTIPDVVTNTVNHTGRPHRDPHHLHSPDPDTIYPKQHQIDHRHQSNAEKFVGGIDLALHPVFR